MKCYDCGNRVVSSGLVYCPRCSAKLNKHQVHESRHSSLLTGVIAHISI